MAFPLTSPFEQEVVMCNAQATCPYSFFLTDIGIYQTDVSSPFFSVVHSMSVGVLSKRVVFLNSDCTHLALEMNKRLRVYCKALTSSSAAIKDPIALNLPKPNQSSIQFGLRIISLPILWFLLCRAYGHEPWGFVCYNRPLR